MKWHGKYPRLRGLLMALTLVMATSPVAGQESDRYQPLTAEGLYEGIMNGSLASWVEDPADRTMLSTLMATSYILGVADSSRGKQWCPVQETSAQTLAGPVLDYLADLPKPRYSEDAAAIVVEALAKVQPCP